MLVGNTGVSLNLATYTELKSLKLTPSIPLALLQASEKCCCFAHATLCYLNPLSQNKTVDKVS